MKSNTLTQSPRLRSPKEAAAYLAISERKLWQLTKDQRITAVKFDRVVRYDIADLDSFITEMKERA